MKAVETGRTEAEVWREDGFGVSTMFKRKSKYGGMTAAEIKRLRELEEGNAKLKRMYADVSLEVRALKDLTKKRAGRKLPVKGTGLN